jgi:hypothetical protein
MSFEFLFERYFSGLTSDDISNAYIEVTSKYSGVSSLWKKLGQTIQTQKVNLCHNYLVAWYLCDMYPMKVRDIDADSRPLQSKTIGGVSVSFVPVQGQNSLQELTTNTFGLKAKSMIESSPEAFGIYG